MTGPLVGGKNTSSLTPVHPRRVPLTIVHHANQYQITDGYDNRQCSCILLGPVEGKSGLAWIIELHRRYEIPANLHLKGTLSEAVAWQQPPFHSKLVGVFEDDPLRSFHQLAWSGEK
jgi:hypothetical protein